MLAKAAVGRKKGLGLGLNRLKRFLVGESGANPYAEAALIIVAVLLVVVIYNTIKPAIATSLQKFASVMQQQ